MARSGTDVALANSQAFSRRDIDAMMELFAPDAVVRDRRAVGWGEFDGRDAVRAYYEGLFDNTEELDEDMTVASADGDVVIAPCKARARLTGAAQNDVMTFDYVLKVRVADGLIEELEIYEDLEAAA
jgi:ketosteroid isomerase-like protein